MEKRDPNLLTNRDPVIIEKVAAFFYKTARRYHRAEVRGLARIPPRGGVIYVGNHNGYPYMTEGWLFTSALFEAYGMDRFPYMLMHPMTLELPVLNQLFTAYGCIVANSRNALRVLQEGHPLLIYPGADEELMRPHRDRTKLRFHDRDGHIRMAVRYGTPIVPVASVGGHSTAMILDDLPWLAEWLGVKQKFNINAWPLMLSIPWGLTLGPIIPPYIPWPSKIIVEAQEPIRFDRTGPKAAADKEYIAACAKQVESSLTNALERLDAERIEKHGLMRFAADQIIAGVNRFLTLPRQTAPEALPEPTPEAPQERLPTFAEFMDISAYVVNPPVKTQAQKNAQEPVRQTHRVDQPNLSVTKPKASVPKATAKRAPGKKLDFTKAQMSQALLKASNGMSVAAVCREVGISVTTFYRWRKRLALPPST